MKSVSAERLAPSNPVVLTRARAASALAPVQHRENHFSCAHCDDVQALRALPYRARRGRVARRSGGRWISHRAQAFARMTMTHAVGYAQCSRVPRLFVPSTISERPRMAFDRSRHEIKKARNPVERFCEKMLVGAIAHG